MPTATRDRTEALADVIKDPVKFARGVLCHQVWNTQAAILRALNRPGARVAVKACHASSKTFGAAEAVLWWLARWQHAIAVTTSATGTQVEKELWGEIHKAIQTSRLAYPPLNLKELKLGPDRYAIGISTNEAERFHGFHGEHVLVVIDEAPGVRAVIWEAIEGIRAGGDVRVLALGNPTIPSGPFYDAFSKDRSGWQTFTINAFDTPNLAGLSIQDLLALPEHELDIAPCPYLVTRRWVAEKYAEWGPASPLWEAKVLGQFPEEASNAVVPLSWVLRCQEERTGDMPLVPIELGVDVGAGGDMTVIRERCGARVGRVWRSHSADPMEVVGLVVQVIQQTGATAVKVDVVGIGWGVAGRLQELRGEVHKAAIVGVNVGQASYNPERFPRLRDQLWWEIGRELCQGQVWDLTALDDTTVAQLIAPRYSLDSFGRIKVEPKDETRERLRRSPDDADALLLAYLAMPGEPPQGRVVYDDRKEISPI